MKKYIGIDLHSNNGFVVVTDEEDRIIFQRRLPNKPMQYLAHLLRLGLLPEGCIFPPELRTVRELARMRMQLVHYWTTQILSIENTLARETRERDGSAI